MAIAKTIFLMFLIIPFIFAVNFMVTTSFAASGDSTVVELHGQLRVEENRIVDQHGKPVALHGMSLFWSQWMDQYYNCDCIKWLRDDWNCTVIRAAMGIEHDGYLENPEQEMKKITTVVDACIELGMYVIVDWHDHNAHRHLTESVSFFEKLATQYGDTPNLIYEIYNEPEKVSWDDVVKPYSQAVVSSIRAIDADNIIIVGTPTWSQDVNVAAQNPMDCINIVYALHFYAATHKQYLRDRAKVALDKGVALFVSEFGTCEYTGDGIIDHVELNKWMELMDEHKISWCNWSVADKNETSAALKKGASATGNWKESDLSESGKLIRAKIQSYTKQ